MIDSWKEFLLAQGARYAGGEVTDFGAPESERRAARHGTVLVDLSPYSILRAHGPDTQKFLDGQLTNNIGLLDTGGSQLSAWCSPKGRMLVVFRVLQYAEGYLLQLPAALRDQTLKRLRMYVLRSKVTLEDADNDFVRIGIAGPEAPALVRSATGVLPEAVNRVVRTEGLVAVSLPGASPRFEILSRPTDAPALWQKLAPGTVSAGIDAWTWHDIAAGLPAVLPETSDAFVPQMANLELLGGVSFTKGCYTGQEIVARLHYRGRLKQRMYRARTDAVETPPPGTPVYASGRADQSTGTVVIATPDPEGGQDLLAVIHCDAAEGAVLHLRQPDGPRLRIEPLPYALTRPG